jgi:hypothetical protein
MRGEWCYGSTHSLPSGIHGGGGQRHALADVPPGKSPLITILDDRHNMDDLGGKKIIKRFIEKN